MKYAIVMNKDREKLKRVLKILNSKGYVWASGDNLDHKISFDPEYILVGLDGNKIYWCSDEAFFMKKCEKISTEKISADLFIELAKKQRKKLEGGTPVMITSDTSQHGFKIGSVAIVLDDAGDGDIYAMGFADITKGACEKYLSENDYEVMESE